jgi:hypothetical protein
MAGFVPKTRRHKVKPWSADEARTFLDLPGTAPASMALLF